MSFCLLTPASSKFSKEQSPSWIMMREFRLGEHGTGHSHTSPCVCAKSLELCPTLCDPMDCSPPGSSVHGLLQTRILEWVAMPSSRVLSDPGIKPRSLPLQADSLPLSHQEVPPVPAWVINSERKGRAEIKAQLLKHFLNNQKNVYYNMGSHLTIMTSKQETQSASRHI